MPITQEFLDANGIPELTEEEILSRYGDVLAEGISAFRSDPDYIVEMAEAATKSIERRQAVRESWTPERRAETSERSKRQAAARASAKADPIGARNEKIVALYEHGSTISEISESTGLSESGVQHVLDAKGIVRERRRSSRWEQRDQRIADLHARGMKQKDIAALLGVSKGTVSLRLKRISGG